MERFRLHPQSQILPLQKTDHGYLTADGEWLIHKKPGGWRATGVDSNGQIWGKPLTPLFETREGVVKQLHTPGENILPILPLRRIHQPVKKYKAECSHYVSFDPTLRLYNTACGRFAIDCQHGKWRVKADNCAGNESVVNGFGIPFKKMREAIQSWIEAYGFHKISFQKRDDAIRMLEYALDCEQPEKRFHALPISHFP